MSRHRRREGRPALARPGRATRVAATRLMGLGLALILIATALLVSRSWRPGLHTGHTWWGHAGIAGPPAPALPDSRLRLRPEEAFARASQLTSAGDARGSLPFYRHAFSFHGAPPQAYVGYSDGLHNAAMQSRSLFGVPGMATSSSLERVALLRQSLAELDTAENLAKTPSGRALVHASRANRFVIWGLPWEALVEFSKAEADQPGQWQAVADELSERLHHPERPDPGARKSPGALPRP